MQESPKVSCPGTNLEVEIVLPIPLGGRLLKAGARSGRILLRETP